MLANGFCLDALTKFYASNNHAQFVSWKYEQSYYTTLEPQWVSNSHTNITATAIDVILATGILNRLKPTKYTKFTEGQQHDHHSKAAGISLVLILLAVNNSCYSYSWLLYLLYLLVTTKNLLYALRDHSFSTNAKFSRKLPFLTLWCTCTYQESRNVSFSENC